MNEHNYIVDTLNYYNLLCLVCSVSDKLALVSNMLFLVSSSSA